MKYQFRYRNSSFDFWQLSMYYIYGSMVGVCNVIFTVAVFVLTFTMWTTANDTFKLLMVTGCLLFTVIQPLAIYYKAGRQAKNIQQDTQITIDDSGIHVKIGADGSTVKWNKIKRISLKPTMIIIFSDTTHGFVLTNKVVGPEKEALFTFINSKIAKK